MTRDLTVEAGIPVLGEVEVGIAQARNLREGGFGGKIHVSVNHSSGISKQVRMAADALGIRVSEHKVNLGLYGNFRFLVDSARADKFFWLAVDDSPPWDLLNFLAHEPGDRDETLLWSQTQLVPELKPNRNHQAEYPHSRFTEGFERKNIFDFHPSHIFGIWDLGWLKANFPPSNFDWLDVYLLSLAYLEGTTKLVPGLRQIGTTKKAPHRVNGRYHRPFGWTLHAGYLAIRHAKQENIGFLFAQNLKAKALFSAKEFLRYHLIRLRTSSS